MNPISFHPKKTLNECLEEFYFHQGINKKSITEPINYVTIWFIKIPFLNIKSRQDLIYLHDINHVLINAGTTFSEEGRVAAFELSSGFLIAPLVGYIYAPLALMGGLFAAPIRTIKSLKKYRGTKNSTFLKGTKKEILSLSLEEARRALGIFI